jgi:hypothetical protein
MSDIANIEAHIADMQSLVDRKDLAMRLEQNRDFKKLILEGFIEVECARFARQSGNPALSAENRADALALAQSAGHLQRYLSMVVQMGFEAEKQIKQGKEAIDEMRQEGAGE